MRINKKHLNLFVALFSLYISPFGWAIIAIDDNYVIPQDSPGFIIDPSANDILDLLSLLPLSTSDFQLSEGQGTVVVSPTEITVVPAPGFVGQLVFIYVTRDLTGSDSARIVIDVQANAAPHQAVNDFHHVLENDTAIVFDVLANDNYSVANGAQIVSTGASLQGGTVNIDPSGLFLDYVPPLDYVGLDTFTYDLQDQVTAVISTATVTVLVGVNPGVNLPIIGATDEEQDTINVLDQICNDDPNGVLPCGFIATLTDAQKRSLARQIGGRHAKAQSRAMRHIKNRQSNNIRTRLSEIRSQSNRVSVNNLNTVVYNEQVPLGQAFQSEINQGVGGAAGDGDGEITTPWGFFANGNISLGEGRGDSDKPQYDQDGFNLTIGSDYRFNDNLVFGGAFGYSESNLDFTFNRGTQNSDSYTFSFFGNYYPTENFYIDFLAMWVNADLDITRRISVATLTQSIDSATSSQQFVFAGTAGYNFDIYAWQGSLYLRAEYSDLTIDAYQEQGFGPFSLNVQEQQTSTVDYAFGARLGYVFSRDNGVIIPSIDIETIEQGDEEFAIQSSFSQVSIPQSLAVSGQEDDKQYINIGASLTGVFGSGRSYYFRYEAVTSHDEYQASTYALGLRVEF